MKRKDTIFRNMLSSTCTTIGKFEAPVIVNESVLRQALVNADPPIMKTLFRWLQQATDDNRMAVFTTKHGDTWAVMNTTRVALDQSRTIDWVHTRTEPCQWLQDTLNPVWVTTYASALYVPRQHL